MRIRSLLIFSLVSAFIFGANLAAYSQEKPYPNKPINIIVGMRAGGGLDLFFRLLSEELKNTWKVPVNIDNQATAMGISAANAVAASKKDGYTLLGSLTGTLSSITSAQPNGPVNVLRDFDPIFADIEYSALAFCVRADSPFKTVKDIVDYAKSKPGELIAGTTPKGTGGHLEWELFKRAAKIDAATVIFSGSSEVVPQLLGGHIQIGAMSDITAKTYIDAKKLRGIATAEKSIVIPEVPTFTESGYPEINLFDSIILLGPHDSPTAVIKTWHSALEVIFKDPKFIASTKKLGFKPNYTMDAQKITGFLKSDIQKYSRFSPEDLGWK